MMTQALNADNGPGNKAHLCHRFMAKFKYYAVVIDRTSGVYMSWLECKIEVHEFSVPVYRGFQNLEEANEFITKHAVSVLNPSANLVGSQAGETEFLDDHSTPLLTSSRRGSTSSAPTSKVYQIGPLQREALHIADQLVLLIHAGALQVLHMDHVDRRHLHVARVRPLLKVVSDHRGGPEGGAP